MFSLNSRNIKNTIKLLSATTIAALSLGIITSCSITTAQDIESKSNRSVANKVTQINISGQSLSEIPRSPATSRDYFDLLVADELRGENIELLGEASKSTTASLVFGGDVMNWRYGYDRASFPSFRDSFIE